MTLTLSPLHTLTHSQITPGGKAAKAGLRFNDYITEINGDLTEGLLHSDAMMLIKTTGVSLQLRLSKDAPKSPQVAPIFSHEETDVGSSPARPQPPPLPTNVTPPKPVTYTSSATVKTNAPVQMKCELMVFYHTIYSWYTRS